MKKNHPCYESAVKRNLRSLFDRHEPGALAFLFCQLILRAFIESLSIIARTRTSGGKSSLRSLTYHRSLVVDRSTLPFKPYRQSLISKRALLVQWERYFHISGFQTSSSRATILSFVNRRPTLGKKVRWGWWGRCRGMRRAWWCSTPSATPGCACGTPSPSRRSTRSRPRTIPFCCYSLHGEGWQNTIPAARKKENRWSEPISYL